MLSLLGGDPGLAVALVTFAVAGVEFVREAMRGREQTVVVQDVHVYVHTCSGDRSVGTLSATDDFES